MPFFYPIEQQVEMRQDRGLVEAEQPPSVLENGLPPPYNQLFNISQSPVPAVPPGQPEARPGGTAVRGRRTRELLSAKSRCRLHCAVWGTVLAVLVVLAVIVLSVVLTSRLTS